MNNERIAILVIEDNLADAELIRIFLDEASFRHEFHHCESLFEGIQALQEHPIDLVLLDLSLKDTIGFKTLKSFREKAPDFPVIIMTGMNNEIMGMQSVRAGAQDFLVKGEFDSKLLVRSIRYALQRFNSQRRLQATIKQLEISERRYREAQEMAQFGDWEMDIVSNSMKWTEQVFRIFDLPPFGLQPTLSHYLSYVHPEDKETVESFFADAEKDGELHQLEHRIVIGGRMIKYVVIQARLIIEEETGQLNLMGGIQDISERKISEQLIRAGNPAILDKILPNIGFLIRTSLSSVINLLYLLDKSSLEESQRELMDELIPSVDDLSIMTNNLLNFSLFASEDPKVVEEELKLKEFISSIEKVSGLKAESANKPLEVLVDPNLPDKILGDPRKITQILYNLLDTTIKFSDSPSVKINIGMVEQDKKYFLEVKVNDVGETSIGGKDNLDLNSEKVLELYQEDPEVENQRQISLAIINKLIELLGGSFQMASTKQSNAVDLSLHIPVQPVLRKPTGDLNSINAPLKILLVEDHFLNQMATRRVLTSWSEFITVDIAENGLIGYEKFMEHGYDMVLMDIQMPVMDGLQAAQRIREKSEVPIIALTANSSKQEQEKCFAIGMNDYLSKPFAPEDLQAKILSLTALVH